ncbi:MAG TPA: hypothetical protein PLX93_01265, partial [Bacilli bacterium]|nr:hypothetical protein [Bacilli bacterium]
MKPNKIPAIAIFSVFILASCGPTVVEDNFYRFNDKEAVATLTQARKGTYISDMPRSGESRVLVVPVEFSDFPASGMLRGAEGAREDLRKAYFGESEETQWESLSSYYAKSSYGKVNITGQVMPWYRPKNPSKPSQWYSTEEIISSYGSSESTGISRLILGWFYTDYAIDMYQNVLDDEGNPYATAAAFFKDYDGDGDGYIDAVQMVYSAPVNHLSSDLFWAFRSVDSSSAPNKNSPFPCAYVWLGYDFIYENGYYDNLGVYHDWTDAEIIAGTAEIDAHTIIHESGHALGADDYYTYDEKDWGALGGTDMMDYNI